MQRTRATQLLVVAVARTPRPSADTVRFGAHVAASRGGERAVPIESSAPLVRAATTAGRLYQEAKTESTLCLPLSRPSGWVGARSADLTIRIDQVT